MDNVRRSPLLQTRLGIKDDYDKWQDLSDEHFQAGLELTRQHLTMLKGIDQSKLDDTTRVSYLLMQQELQQELDDAKWRLYSYPVNQMFGTHSQVPSLLINQHSISSGIATPSSSSGSSESNHCPASDRRGKCRSSWC